MAEELSRSDFVKRLNKKAKGGMAKAKHADPKARGRQLPGGIKNGVAKLSSFKLSETKNGDEMLTITGIVVEPEDCHGMRCNIMHFLNESEYASLEDNLSNLCADLQLLEIDTPSMGDNIGEYLDALEERCNENPYFLFNTQTKKNGNTAIYLQGLADENYVPENDVDLDSEAGSSRSADEGGGSDLDVGARVQVDYDGEMFGGEITVADDDGATILFDDGTEADHTWDEIVAEESEPEASDSEWEVGTRVQVDYDGEMYPGEIAALDGDTASITFDDGSEADHDVSELVAEEEPAETEADDDWEPEVDSGYSYKPGRGAAVVMFVTKVNKRAKTVDGETEDGSKKFTKVPWDSLGEA